MHAEQRHLLVHEGSRLRDKIAPQGRLVNHFPGIPHEPRTGAKPGQIARSYGASPDHPARWCGYLLNSRGGTRTPDPVINSHLLYQLSYSGSSMAWSCSFLRTVGRPKTSGASAVRQRGLQRSTESTRPLRAAAESAARNAPLTPAAPGSLEAPITLSRPL